MKKRWVFLCCFLCGLLKLYGYNGGFVNKSKLRVSKTEWFDIIYEPESEKMAHLLFENVDCIYDEVTAQYGMTPQFRMPVVIVKGIDNFNAYWTVVPYNHIVLYDTSVSGIDDLSVFSNTVLSVFRHELTHGVTFNMKNGFWNGVSKVFGDAAVPGMLLVSTGMAEGATVTSESASGEGRLNDEYAKQTVRQAKLENKFPGYYDAIGSRDKYPASSAYYFNGAFHKWLQDKYGMEAYANFWYNVVNCKKVTVNGNFKKAYGIKLSKAWKEFANDYSVPDIPGNPVEAEIVDDFFQPSKSSYTIENNRGSIYESLTVTDKWIAWLDSASSKVYYVENQDLSKDKITPKSLGRILSVQSVSGSPDGKYMLFSTYGINGADIVAALKVYNTETKKTFTLDETGLKEGAIFNKGDDYYVVADKYLSPEEGIYIAKLSADKNLKVEKIAIIPQSAGCIVSDFAGLKSGNFAYIKNNQLKYSICVADVQGNLIAEYAAPKDRMIIHSLSEAEGFLYFSWSEPGFMPRLGKLSLETGTMILDTQEISGGVYSPVCVDGKIIYTGNFYNQSRLLRYNSAFESAEILESGEASEQEQAVTAEELFAGPMEYEPYHSFDYLKRGIFVPFSLYQTEYFGCNSVYTSDINYYPIGITYITANPWTNGSNDLYQLTSGWNYLNNSFGTELLILKATNSPVFTAQIDLKTEVDRKGWKLGAASLNLTSRNLFGNYSSISFENTLSGKAGRQDKRNADLTSMDLFAFYKSDYFECVASVDNIYYYSLSDVFSATYSNVHKAGPGRFEKLGASFTLGTVLRHDEAITDIPVIYTHGMNILTISSLYIPKLIPVSSYYGLVYNLPSKVELSTFPSKSINGYTKKKDDTGLAVMDIKTETILLGLDVQKALPGLYYLYLNNFYISGGYALTFVDQNIRGLNAQWPYHGAYYNDVLNGKAEILDSIYLKTVIEFTPNIGTFADSNYKISFYSMINYSLHTKDTSGVPFRFLMGVQSSF